MDLRRETDIEQLRRVAFAQQVQIEQLLRVLKAKCDELEAFKGNPEKLQQTLALIETLAKQQAAAAATTPKKASKKAPKQREKFGSTDQPDLPHVYRRGTIFREEWRIWSARSPHSASLADASAFSPDSSESVPVRG